MGAEGNTRDTMLNYRPKQARCADVCRLTNLNDDAALCRHAIGPKRQMPRAWGQRPQDSYMLTEHPHGPSGHLLMSYRSTKHGYLPGEAGEGSP